MMHELDRAAMERTHDLERGDMVWVIDPVGDDITCRARVSRFYGPDRVKVNFDIDGGVNMSVEAATMTKVKPAAATDGWSERRELDGQVWTLDGWVKTTGEGERDE